MSTLLQKLMIALGRRGVQTPIGDELAAAYRALQEHHAAYPTAFGNAADILLAEVEGGATALAEIPTRIDHLCRMLDALYRQEELDALAEEPTVVVG